MKTHCICCNEVAVVEQIFSFRITPVDSVQMQSQVSRALEKRTEWISRRKYPKMWEMTDKLNSVEQIPAAVRENRKKRRAFLGMFSWILGVVLLVPALMEPQTMIASLATGAGCFAVGCGVLWRNGRSRLSMLNLVLGMILCLGVLGDLEELKGILIFGIVSLVIGAAALLTRKRERENPFDRAAALLLQEISSREGREGMLVSFCEQGMTIAEKEGVVRQQVPYGDFQLMLETEDLFLPVWQDCVTVVQKKDLCTGTIPALQAFLRERIQYVCVVER